MSHNPNATSVGWLYQSLGLEPGWYDYRKEVRRYKRGERSPVHVPHNNE